MELDLDMNMEKMGVLSARSPSQEEVPGAREVGGQSEEKQAIQEEQQVRSARKKTTPC